MSGHRISQATLDAMAARERIAPSSELVGRPKTVFEQAIDCAERRGLPTIDIKAHQKPDLCVFCAGETDGFRPYCDFCNETDV